MCTDPEALVDAKRKLFEWVENVEKRYNSATTENDWSELHPDRVIWDRVLRLFVNWIKSLRERYRYPPCIFPGIVNEATDTAEIVKFIRQQNKHVCAIILR